MSNDFIVYLLHQSVDENDAEIPHILGNLFHRMQLTGVNYPSLDSEGMVEFTASLAECIQAGINKERLHAEVNKLASDKIPSEDYYAISYLPPKRQ